MPNFGTLKQLHADFTTLGQDARQIYQSWLVRRQLQSIGRFMDQLLGTKGVCQAALGLAGGSLMQKSQNQFKAHLHQTAHHLGMP